MATSAVSSILQGFTVRSFDNGKSGADNEGLVCPTGASLAGFYIVELGILVINKFEGGEGVDTDTDFSLPTYVPSVKSFVQMASLGVIAYDTANNFITWSGVRYGNGRHIYTNTRMQKSFSSGCAVAYLKPYEVSGESASYANATSYNQII